MVVKRWIETGDLWKDRARSVQLRLRDRFRVAVDSHRTRSRQRFSGGDAYSSMERWLKRFRDFRRDSLPSSSTFYRKRVSEDIDAEADSVLTRMLQAVAVPVIGNVCHVFMHGLNRVQIYGAEKLQHALLNRPRNKPLITVSNHVASMDDPLVIAALLPPRVLLDAHSLRWTLCATDRCFRNPVTSAFFKYVKVLPVSRGDGIYQKGMDMAIAKLNRGEWVHIFPEGSRSRDGGKTMGSPKRGIGRLVLDADIVPLVVPFVHSGMKEIMPIGAKIPRIGKTVTVLIGDPIYFEDIINTEENENVQRGELYDAVAARIGDRLQRLKAQVDTLAIEQSLRSKNFPEHVTERAAGILQQVDWELLGIDNYVGIEDYSSSSSWSSLKQDLPAQVCSDQVQQENNCQNQHVRVGFSSSGGIVSRIRGYMDSTELMGFAARGLFMNCRVQENFGNIQGVGPLKAWNNFWKSMYVNCNTPTNFMFAAAM